MSQTINYSLCWEDQDILKILHQDGHEILIVGSGGCLSLSSLAYKNVSLHLVEINELQNKLIRLKVCAFNNLSFENCMYFFGTFSPPKEYRDRLDIFWQLSDHLSSDDRKYWKSNLKMVSKGLIHIGKWERYLQTWNRYFLPAAIGRRTIDDFINSNNIQEQKNIYKRKVDRFLHRLILRTFASKMIQSRFGRHPDLLKYFNDSPGDIFYKRLEKAWCKIPIVKNYYFRYMLESHYRRSMTLPDWAIKENYNIINKRTSNISFHSNSMMEYLLQTDKTFDMIYISNITDTFNQKESSALFQQCASHLKRDGKLVIWNNLVERKPSEKFLLMEELSHSISKNRLATYYGYFGVYGLR